MQMNYSSFFVRGGENIKQILKIFTKLGPLFLDNNCRYDIEHAYKNVTMKHTYMVFY